MEAHKKQGYKVHKKQLLQFLPTPLWQAVQILVLVIGMDIVVVVNIMVDGKVIIQLVEAEFVIKMLVYRLELALKVQQMPSNIVGS